LDDFDQFWTVFPKKVAKADARKAWLQTKDVRPPVSEVIQAIKNACKQESWMKSGGAFIPYPATWLRGERWEDEFEVVLPNVVNEKPWYETSTGIELKGKEFGLKVENFPNFPAFRAAVMQASLKAA
jgi:hypothetical protein